MKENIRKEIMDIIEMLIEEKKIVEKVQEREDFINKQMENIRKLRSEIEVDNVKALKKHKDVLNNVGRIVIKEK